MLPLNTHTYTHTHAHTHTHTPPVSFKDMQAQAVYAVQYCRGTAVDNGNCVVDE